MGLLRLVTGVGRVVPVIGRNLSDGVGTGSDVYDVAVVGGGIVGLATARQLLLSHPEKKVVVLEKEKELAMHQTGHNSGVIHTGIYYKPGSLKAKLCVEGCALTYEYCDQEGIPYKRCGKVIVAVNQSEVARLDALFERGKQNGVPDLRLIGPEELQELEPHCQGVKAIHSPNTGIVDWSRVAKSYACNVEACGGSVRLRHEVADFSVHRLDSKSSATDSMAVAIYSKGQERVLARNVIACCGLHSDRLAAMSGCNRDPRIVPFRGDYLVLNSSKTSLVNGNIYPVPDPRFPFLGVHFTPRMDGSVWLGPNAILAFSREGYKRTDVNLADMREIAAFRGLRKLACKYLSFGIGEMYRSIDLRAQVTELKRYVPELTVADVQRGPSGVRAQALDNDGNLVDDFVFDSGTGQLGAHMLHVRNAPSPGATSSLAIAHMIVEQAKQQWPAQFR